MIRRMKIHYYGLRYYFLIFLILFALFASLSLTVLETHFDNLLPILFIAFFISAFVLGIYEYNRIAYMHRSILVNRNPFFICSIVFGIINIVLLLGVFIGYAFLVNTIHMVDISFVYNPYFYLIFITFFSFAYIIGNLYGLIFIRKLKINIFMVLLIFALFSYFEIKLHIIIELVSNIIYFQLNNLHLIGFMIIPIILIFAFINKILFKKKN